MHPEIKELEYAYVENGIYIGSNQCCQTHFEFIKAKSPFAHLNDAQLQALKEFFAEMNRQYT